MNEDRADLRERLRHLARGASGRVIPVVGSALSYGSVVTTDELADRFVSALTERYQEGLRDRWTAETPSYQRYQMSATLLARHQGDRAVTAIIRESVLEALVDGDAGRGLATARELTAAVRDGTWRLTKAHRDFAEFYANLPFDARGPIVTTNFDPLVEVALRSKGIETSTFPIPFDDPPTLEQLHSQTSVPILHIHGYFASPWSLNSLQHIAAPRAKLEGMLSALFADSTVVVLGYGGWEDSFMRVLQRHSAQQTVLNAEIVWVAHQSDPAALYASNATLGALSTSPGFQMYRGIDVFDLFDVSLTGPVRRSIQHVPSGWTALPIGFDEPHSVEGFAQGEAPDWSDAVHGRWPTLGAAVQLDQMLRDTLLETDAAGVAAVGPIGEGKSMAIRQVAAGIAAAGDGWTVLWREQGAPAVSEEWFRGERQALGDVLFVIDEADLARADIQLVVEHANAGPHRSRLLVASHDRHWWMMPPTVTSRLPTVVFDGVSSDDAELIAHAWSAHGLGVHGGADATSSEVLDAHAIAQALIDASQPGYVSGRSTLMGAILTVREAGSLETRIRGLLDRLDGVTVRAGSDLTLRDVYGVICLLQVYTDPESTGSHGATRELIAKIVNAGDSLENVAVLRALGREASLSFAGRFVFSRHAVIAKIVVAHLDQAGVLGRLSRLAANAGAQMKQAGASEREDYLDAYALARRISDPQIAIQASIGAIEGANEYLEPRVTSLSIQRRNRLGSPLDYAEGIASVVMASRDRSVASRAYLNELALTQLWFGDARLALGAAALGLHDHSGGPLSLNQANFCIGTMSKVLAALVKRSSTEYRELVQLVAVVSRQVFSPDELRRFVLAELPRVDVEPAIADRSPAAQVALLAAKLSPFASSAVDSLHLPFGAPSGRDARFRFVGGLEWDQLAQLVESRHRS